MKVTRKGPVISTLDADWLELTTFYYKQGLSLIDSFVCWETPRGKFLVVIMSLKTGLMLEWVEMCLPLKICG